jgi:DNA modification methylase
VIEFADYTGNKLHPSQKPITILLPLIEAFSAPGAVVLNPFAGSGSSLLAAKMLGRRYIGIELDATYHAAAQRRLQEASAGVSNRRGGAPAPPLPLPPFKSKSR